MKKIIYSVLAAMMILNGCEEYHPFYDGQSFCINDAMTQIVIKADGEHIYVPLQYDVPYVIECFGGKGKNYTVTVSDPECLDYSLEVGDVKTPPFDWSVIPTKITLNPKNRGDVSLTVKDDDTGESVMMNVHIRDAYHAMEVDYGSELFKEEIILVFKYGGTDDELYFCKGSIFNYDPEPFAEGKYSFVMSDGFLYFEMTYFADEDGRPSESGVETFRRYQVQMPWGTDDPATMMIYMNLSACHVNTKGTATVAPDSYYYRFEFVDVTDFDFPLTELVEPYRYLEDGSLEQLRDILNVYSARLIPWKYD